LACGTHLQNLCPTSIYKEHWIHGFMRSNYNEGLDKSNRTVIALHNIAVAFLRLLFYSKLLTV